MTIETDEFLSESKYNPEEFIAANISENAFSILHLNIASLPAHINDLRSLFSLLNHPFHVIGISETKIIDGKDPLMQINISMVIFLRTHQQKQVLVVLVYIFDQIWTIKYAQISQNLWNQWLSLFLSLIEVFLKK